MAWSQRYTCGAPLILIASLLAASAEDSATHKLECAESFGPTLDICTECHSVLCEGDTLGHASLGPVALASFPLPAHGDDTLHVDTELHIVADIDSRGQPCSAGGCPIVAQYEQSVQLLIGFGDTFMPCGGLQGMSSVLPGTSIAASLVCFPKQAQSNLSVWIHASLHLRFELALRTSLRSLHEAHLDTLFGGARGSTSVLAFFITKEEAALERIYLDVPSAEDGNHTAVDETIHAWVFHESSPWIRDLIALGGCVNPEEYITRIKGVISDPRERARPPPSLHLSFRTSTVITLSANSRPPRQTGRWFVLLLCEKDDGLGGGLARGGKCGLRHARLKAESMSQEDMNSLLSNATWMMVLLPVVMLIAVDLLYCLVYHVVLLRAAGGHPFSFLGRPSPTFWTLQTRSGGTGLLWERLSQIFDPEPFFAGLLAIMTGTFIATAFQLSLTNYMDMSATGDRDKCFYNEKCYWPDPVFQTNVPFNHMISHIPYFVAGFHVLFQAILAEDRVRWKVLKAKGLSPGGRSPDGKEASPLLFFEAIPSGQVKLDLRPFYAIAGSLFAEGIGSSSYHLCPSLSVFQFDTAFMVPMVHLFTTPLLDWSSPELAPRAHRIALKYFLFVMVPTWIFSFLGTWFDVGLWTVDGDPLIYKALGFTMMVWVIFAVQGLNIFFRQEASCRRILLKCFIVLSTLGALLFPEARVEIGGMANTFLYQSVVVFIGVVGWQVAVKEVRHQRVRWTYWCGAPDLLLLIVKYPHFFATLVLLRKALECFDDKVVLVDTAATAADSHQANKACVLGDVLDLHDVWHFLSGVGLSLLVMSLLDVKVHDYARENNLVVWLENDEACLSEEVEDEDERSAE